MRLSRNTDALSPVRLRTNWWDKYTVTMQALSSARETAGESLNKFLQELGYA